MEEGLGAGREPTVTDVIRRWAAGEPPLPIGPAVDRSPDAALATIPEACAPLVGLELAGPFTAAVAAGEPAARAAMPAFIVAANALAQEVLGDVSLRWREQDYEFVRTFAPPAAALIVALGGPGAFLDAAIQLRFAAAAHFRLGETQQSVAAYGYAIDLAARLRPQSDELLSICLDNRALALLDVGEVDAAIADIVAAKRIEHDRGGVDDDEPKHRAAIASIENNLGLAYNAAGEYALARAAFHRSLRIIEMLPSGSDVPAAAVVLDHLAGTSINLDDLESGAQMYEDAGALFADHPPKDRYINARSRAGIHALRKDAPKASAAFDEMIQYATDEVRTRFAARRFAEAQERAVAHLVPVDSEAWSARLAALAAAEAGDRTAARRWYERAAELAADAGDRLTQLVCIAAGASIASDQNPREALETESRVRETAFAEGLAVPIILADSASTALLADGVEPVDANSDVVALAVEARMLGLMSAEHMTEYPQEIIARLPQADPGVIAQRLGSVAMEHFAYEAATGFFTEALEVATQVGREASIAVRLDWLLRALSAQASDLSRLRETVARLRQVADGTRRDDVRLRALLSLGNHELEQGDLARAIADLTAAVEPLERLRAAGAAAVLDLQRFDALNQVYRLLVRARLLSSAPDAGTFEFLQRSRARVLMEELHDRRVASEAYVAPTLEETIELLGRMPRPTALVDVVVVADRGLFAFVVDKGGVRRVQVAGDPAPFQKVMSNDARERPADIVDAVRTSPLLRELIEGIEATLEADVAVLVTVDDALANLPFHAVPSSGVPWGDRRPIGRIPAVASLRYSPRSPLAGTSVVAGDSARNLRGAAHECVLVGETLGAEPLLGAACSLDAVGRSLGTGDTAILHLAVHGRADPRRGRRASLLFAADDGSPTWAPFEELANLPWEARLIVLSGCSTAVGGPRDGAGLYGIAQMAARAGATTTIASLWPVNDTSTAVFMIEFYTSLARARAERDWVDLRETMDDARSGVRRWLGGAASDVSAPLGPPAADATAHARDGRELTPIDDDIEIPLRRERDPETNAMLHWAPFVLIGDPIVSLR